MDLALALSCLQQRDGDRGTQRQADRQTHKQNQAETEKYETADEEADTIQLINIPRHTIDGTRVAISRQKA